VNDFKNPTRCAGWRKKGGFVGKVRPGGGLEGKGGFPWGKRRGGEAIPPTRSK